MAAAAADAATAAVEERRIPRFWEPKEEGKKEGELDVDSVIF